MAKTMDQTTIRYEFIGNTQSGGCRFACRIGGIGTRHHSAARLEAIADCSAYRLARNYEQIPLKMTDVTLTQRVLDNWAIG